MVFYSWYQPAARGAASQGESIVQNIVNLAQQIQSFENGHAFAYWMALGALIMMSGALAFYVMGSFFFGGHSRKNIYALILNAGCGLAAAIVVAQLYGLIVGEIVGLILWVILGLGRRAVFGRDQDPFQRL